MATPGQEKAPRARRFGLERAATVLLRLFILLVVFMAGAATAIYWRLTEGPLSLGFLTPQLEAALSPSDGAFKVGIGDTIVALDREEVALEIIARELRVVDRSERTVMTMPEAGISLSLAGLARGMFAPTRLIARDPTVRLLRDEEGSFHVLSEAGASGDDGNLLNYLEELAHPPDPARASGYLKEVALHGGKVTVDDRRLGRVWIAEGLELRAVRGARGVEGHIGAAVAIGEANASLDGVFEYESGARRLIVALAAEGVQPASFAGLAPALAPLATLEASITGRARLTVDIDKARVETSRLDLAVGPGRIVRPELPNGAVSFAGGKVVAEYDPFAARLAVERFMLDLGGPMIEATGSIDHLRLDPGLGTSAVPLEVAADALVRRVPAAELDRLWPVNAAKGAREWVTQNIPEGMVDEATATLRLRVRPDDLDASTLEAFNGTLRYSDLAVHYLRPLPPVTGVGGTAIFDQTRLELSPAKGQLLGVAVTGGLIRVYELDTNDEKLAIDLSIAGPLRDVMTVIDSKPLGYAREVGIDPAKVTGAAAGKLAFRFPLIKDLTFGHVEVAVSATLAEVGVKQLVFDADATEGVLELSLDRNALKLQGGAQLGEVPAALSLAHAFKPDRNGVTTRYTVWSVVDRAGRQRLGLDFLPEMVDGPVAVDASVVERAGKRRQIALTLGLKDAQLSEPLIGYRKAPGVPAGVKMNVEMEDDRPLRIRDLEASGAELDIKGSIAFSGEDVDRVEFTRLRAGLTDLVGNVARRPEGGWRIEAAGAAWDGSMLLGPEKTGATDEKLPFLVDARVGRVTLGPEREARDVTAQLFSDGLHYEMARIDASIGEKGTLVLRFGQAAGARDFRLNTDDFGAALKLMDIYDNIAGGQIAIEGRAEDVGPKRVLRGRLEGADYKLINAPTFAKLLTIASLPAMNSLLSGQGIPFTRITGGFELTEDRLVLDKVRAYGGALGINASGTVDLDQDTIDLAGTLVPAYTINTVLGYIPLLGPLLMGGEGQGLFAANFRAVGPAAGPTITVNPLSALAPGFLRNLFLFDVPGGGAAQAPTPPSPQVKDQ